MKKIAFILSLTFILLSCGSLKLRGTYPESGNYFIETSLSYDEVWDKIIDIFAQCGVPISNIDKTSGLIVSNNMSFINNYTRETRTGSMINPSAYVVIPTVRGGFGNILEPTAAITGNWDMCGDWNVRIKKAENGKTLINVNLLNVRCIYTSGMHATRVPIKSTGIFEKHIINILK